MMRVCALRNGVDSSVERQILVLYPIPPELAGEARAAGVGVTAGDAELLDELIAAGRSAPADAGPPLDVHVEVETGLGRGGFAARDLPDVGRRIAEASGLRLAGLWTHFQAPEDQPRTGTQIARFDRATHLLESAGVPFATRHVAASGGLLLEGVPSFDGVRPGLAVYGLLPDELIDTDGGLQPVAGAAELRPALSLHARPVRVADVPDGWGISYGPTFVTNRPSRIATLPLGYGDGWPRSLSNRAEALVRGMPVPLVGNVAMDAVMADVTEVPGEPVGVHDEFVLIGAQGRQRITVADVAHGRTTNSWEVVTSLAARLPRVYHAASVPRETRTLVGGEVGGRRSRRP